MKNVLNHLFLMLHHVCGISHVIRVVCCGNRTNVDWIHGQNSKQMGIFTCFNVLIIVFFIFEGKYIHVCKQAYTHTYLLVYSQTEIF